MKCPNVRRADARKAKDHLYFGDEAVGYSVTVKGEEAWKPPVDRQGKIDLVRWTGLDERHLPKAIRDPDETFTYVSSVCTALADSTIDPRSGGIAGTANLAAVIGVSPEHFRRHIKPKLHFVHNLEGLLVTNQVSLMTFAEEYHREIHEARCQRLGIVPSSGSDPTGPPEATQLLLVTSGGAP